MIPNKKKILDFVYSNLHNLEADWTEDFIQMNIDEEVGPLYACSDVAGDDYKGNIIFCFVILAYDNESKFLEPHKDRLENKKKIMIKLAGLSAMTKELFVRVVTNKHSEAFNLSNWYLEYQQDWRWRNIMNNIQYEADSSVMVARGALDSKEGLDNGKLLAMAEERRRRADEVLNEIQQEFMNLNKVLEKEDRPHITQTGRAPDFMRWENHLEERNSKA